MEKNKLVKNISFEAYAAHPAINAGSLKEILRSPEHFQYRRHNPPQETDALRFGKILHTAVLEPDKYESNFVVEPLFIGKTKDGRESARSGEAIQKKKDWYDSLGKGVEVVTVEERERVLRMRDRLLSHPFVKNFFEAGGIREGSLLWEDEEFGVLCKARPDFVSIAGFCVNLKTTRDARPESFSSDVRKFGYNFSAAHYIAGGKAAGLFRPDTYIFVVIESEPPHGIRVYSGEVSVLFTGEHEWRKAIKLYSQCLKAGKWPGYPPECTRIEVPEWYENMIQKEAADEMPSMPDHVKSGDFA